MNKQNIKKLHEFSFIPMHLRIEGRPELAVFPYNIFVARHTVNPEGNLLMGSVLYLPYLKTYTEKDGIRQLLYFNKYNPTYYWKICYDINKQSYNGKKYNGNELLGMAVGTEWKMFFIHVGLLGLTKGERCLFKPLGIKAHKLKNQPN